MALLKILQAGAFGANFVYLIGWLLALIGLALEQNWCKDHVDMVPTSAMIGGNFAPLVGSSCRKLLRFPWFIWCLCTLPLLLSIVHNVKPKLVPRGTSGLFAIIAVLTILMCNDFYNQAEAVVGKMDRYAKLTLAGFAVLAIGALFSIIIESGMNPHKTDEEHHGVGGRHHTKGTEPATTTTTTV